MIDAAIYLGKPSAIPIEETRPRRVTPAARGPARGQRRARGALRPVAGHASLGTRRPGPAGPARQQRRVAVRNAQLFAQVEAQNAQLLELDAAKDEFLRGVSHNLQTPLTSIRAHADSSGSDRPDRRLGIITEQSERLSRMVRQLLTVTRLESGTFHPRTEVVALGSQDPQGLGGARRGRRRVRGRRPDRGMAGDRRRRPARSGPLGAPRQRAQVRWAPTESRSSCPWKPDASRLRIDHHRRRAWCARRRTATGCSVDSSGAATSNEQGSGLGLYVSRALCRAMDGDLVLEPPLAGARRGVQRLPAGRARDGGLTAGSSRPSGRRPGHGSSPTQGARPAGTVPPIGRPGRRRPEHAFAPRTAAS